jgi:hypothetical protein
MVQAFFRAPLAAVLTDTRGYTLDNTVPLPVNPAESGTANITTGQISITASAGQIVAANATRRAVAIKNSDATNILFVGSAGVTVATGHRIDPKETLVVPFVGAISGIGSGNLTATFLEVYD